MPSFIEKAFEHKRDEGFLRCALSAIAAANGNVRLAEALLELGPEVTEEFMEWFWNR